MRSGHEWFLFDLGNVLIRLDYDRVLDRIAKKSRVRREELIELMDAPGSYRDLERGLISFREFHQFLRERIGYSEDLRTFRKVWGDFFAGTVEGIEEVLRRVRQQYRIAFLSNSNEVHADVIPRLFGSLFDRSDIFVFSHRLKSAKPDPEIYHRTLETLGTTAQKVLFTDDLAENVTAARNAGIEAFHFTSAVDLLRDLEERGYLTRG
ncbi:MAG: HAD family hydrolase [Thermoanaerobaculia bacterium]